MTNQQIYQNIFIYSFPLTDQGITRSNNEDSYSGYEPTEPLELQQFGCLYIVADGVGGAQFGERASQYAAKKILYDFYQQSGTDPADRLAKIIQNTGNEIFNYSVENGVRMATTLVAANIIGEKLTVANVGDSRAYLFRSGTIKQITRDHNRAAELVRSGMLTSEEAKESKTKNTLTRSLGGDSDENVDLFTDIQLLAGDLILLCSDGLSRYTSENDLLQLASFGTLEEIATRMVDFANRSGGADNITLYLIKVAEGGAAVPTISRYKTPEAIDWETISTAPTIRTKRHKTNPSIFSSIPHLIILLVGLVILLILIVFIISILRNDNRQDENVIPVPAPTEEMVSPLIEIIVPYATETMFINEKSPEPTTANETIVNTPELAAEPTRVSGRNECVHLVRPDEYPLMIFTQFFDPDIQTPNDGIYYIFSNCDLEKKECSNQNKQDTTEDSIPPESFLLIPGAGIENCNSTNGNYWVFIPD